MSKPMFTVTQQAILRFLQGGAGDAPTAADIAAAIGSTARSISASANGLVKNGFVERIEVEGVDKKVLVLTDAGRAADPDAAKPEPEKAEE